MEDLYLILHKVRGQPAFDIAIKSMAGDEKIWIIPTSGHRAYPWVECKLSLLPEGAAQAWFLESLPIPEAWPDHYAFHNLRRRAETPHLRDVSKRVTTDELAL